MDKLFCTNHMLTCKLYVFWLGAVQSFAISQVWRYNLSAFFVTPPLPAPSGVVASARLCCLSRVPPAVCPSLLESTTTVCTSFLQSFPRTYIRRRLIPYYDSGPLHKHQIYIRPIFHQRSSFVSRPSPDAHVWYRVTDLKFHFLSRLYANTSKNVLEGSSRFLVLGK